MPEITGTTRVYYMLAHPIAHVTTPEMFNPICADRGADAVMVPIHVLPQDLDEAFDGFRRTQNLGGLVVSVPHKQRMLELCDEVGVRAAELGAANCVRREPDGRLVCDNFDGEGFMAGLASADIDVRGQRVLVVGAGGGAAAIGFALAKAGAAQILFADLDTGRAERLSGRIAAACPGPIVATTTTPPSPAGHDIIVNASDCGLRPHDPLPIVTEELEPGHTVCDIIMKPKETALLEAARARDCRIHHGIHMLEKQMELFWDFFGLPR